MTGNSRGIPLAERDTVGLPEVYRREWGRGKSGRIDKQVINNLETGFMNEITKSVIRGR